MLSRDFDAEGMPQMAPKGRKSVGLPIERETMLTGPIHSIYKARFAQVVVTFPSSLTPTFPSLILLPFSGSSLRLFQLQRTEVGTIVIFLNRYPICFDHFSEQDADVGSSGSTPVCGHG